jgi:hypothetical protein
MIEHEYFTHLNTGFTLGQELLAYCENQQQLTPLANPSNNWTTFNHVPMPWDLLAEDPLCQRLRAEGWRGGIYCFFATSWYKFHLDTVNRPCVINMLLGGPHSHTLYLGPELYRNQNQILEVDYSPGRATLMNTCRFHAVLNLSGPRFLLSWSPPLEWVQHLWQDHTAQAPLSLRIDPHSDAEQVYLRARQWIAANGL